MSLARVGGVARRVLVAGCHQETMGIGLEGEAWRAEGTGMKKESCWRTLVIGLRWGEIG